MRLGCTVTVGMVRVATLIRNGVRVALDRGSFPVAVATHDRPVLGVTESIAANSVAAVLFVSAAAVGRGRVLQEERRAADPGTAAALDAFLTRLDACIAVERPFTLILGACHILVLLYTILPLDPYDPPSVCLPGFGQKSADLTPARSVAPIVPRKACNTNERYELIPRMRQSACLRELLLYGCVVPAHLSSGRLHRADDPAGNSFVEPAAGPAGKDPLLRVEYYDRTLEQTRAIGLSTGADDTGEDQPSKTGRVVRTSLRASLCGLRTAPLVLTTCNKSERSTKTLPRHVCRESQIVRCRDAVCGACVWHCACSVAIVARLQLVFSLRG